ncbi:3'-5' exonuclease [Actinomadura parmotrematis]|uniref:3'-5' exonuclease n=1 Tax=Actinomadura parmotrematis TaxID=2864039 RepID=A0ABS7G262_9ACTN|nr:3'-5' exonuclease [Actinomadura parmotrematis]MBW8485922.1 3'-5' exonuclease [Actinomadura parmotrematis]
MTNDALLALDALRKPGGAAVYAVLDTETSGFSPARGDAMLEIAIVLLDAAGEIVEEWDSLLDPRGPVGADWVHGITPAMVRGAPTFRELAGEIGGRLAGRIIVAHNASFDMRFLRAEAGALGAGAWAPETLCTQRLAGTFLPPGVRKLADCCAAVGIPLDNAHAALDDARATARLFRHYLRNAPRPLPWSDKLARAAEAAAWPSPRVPQRPSRPRQVSAARRGVGPRP